LTSPWGEVARSAGEGMSEAISHSFRKKQKSERETGQSSDRGQRAFCAFRPRSPDHQITRSLALSPYSPMQFA
jgi:hypothetical protein